MWNATSVAERAVAEARAVITERYRDLRPAVFHYGAVDIEPRHLVIWVLLDCWDDAIPPWRLYPEPRTGESIAPELRAKLLAIQHPIRAVLAQDLRPDANDVRVGFETHHRVEDGGGWQYFK